MAVKKATAKKSVAKRPAAKRSTSKKAVVKKKSRAKKSVSKKTVAKKSATKKSPVKKSALKKRAAKKKPTKSAAKSVDRFVVPPVPVSSLSRAPRVEVSTVPAPAPASIPVSVPAPVPLKKQGPSGRVVFAVVVGIILLALIVWTRAHKTNVNEGVTPSPTPTATATETASATPTPTPLASSTAVIAAHEAPQGVVAHYTTPGATIFWKAPTAVDGLTGYNIEISVSNGPWKLISTVPVTQTSLDIVKVNTNGWTSFRVSSVYSDSQITSAKAFGLPGTYS